MAAAVDRLVLVLMALLMSLPNRAHLHLAKYSSLCLFNVALKCVALLGVVWGRGV